MSLPRARAKFEQKCPGCGDPIEEGDLIFKLDEEDGGDWVCSHCEELASS